MGQRRVCSLGSRSRWLFCMSTLRLLSLTYLAGAGALSLVLLAHTFPDIGREAAIFSQVAQNSLWNPVMDTARQRDADTMDHPATFRLAIRPLAPGELRTLPHADEPRVVPQRRVAEDDHLTDPNYSASAIIPIVPDLSPEAAPVPPAPTMPEPRLASPSAPHVHRPISKWPVRRRRARTAAPKPRPGSSSPACRRNWRATSISSFSSARPHRARWRSAPSSSSARMAK